MSDQITGLWAAMTTPIAADGQVDHTALVTHAKFLTQNGCDGLVPFGTTGEGTSFSAREKLAATEALLNAGIPAGQIALGTGCPAIPDTVALTRDMMGLRRITTGTSANRASKTPSPRSSTPSARRTCASAPTTSPRSPASPSPPPPSAACARNTERSWPA